MGGGERELRERKKCEEERRGIKKRRYTEGENNRQRVVLEGGRGTVINKESEIFAKEKSGEDMDIGVQK